MLNIIPLPTIEYNSARGAAAFVLQLRSECPDIIMDAPGVWHFYADYYANHVHENDRPLTRSQLFRQLRSAGLHRFRSGARDSESGKRPYLYRLASPKRPRRRPQNVDDARPWGVVV